jgi:predicted ATP-dependent endonuclease of OLD family
LRVIKLTVRGYRSLREEVELQLDPLVTVVLGANDHGKSNLLNALAHLNPDHPFDEADLNWDCLEGEPGLPSVRYELQLSDDERTELQEAERLSRARVAVEGFLQAAAEAREQAEAAVVPLRARLQEATDQLSVTESEFEAETATASQEGTPPPTDEALTAAREQVEDVAMATEPAEAALAAVNRRVLIGEGRLLEIDDALAGNDPEDAIARAVVDARETHESALAAETVARQKQGDAVKAHETATAQGDADQIATALKAAQTAETSLKRYQRETIKRRDAVSRLEATSDAVSAWRSGQVPDGDIDLKEPKAENIKVVPLTVLMERRGLQGGLSLVDAGFGTEIIDAFVRRRLPRVQLVEPGKEIPDQVNYKALTEDGGLFMRGILHYAGLAPNEWESIFNQNDMTQYRLQEASRVLNETLRESWRQGRTLEFLLQHDSAKQRIALRIKDPAVQQTFVRASCRSSGFTHFFALKTTLNALEREAPASSYLWVFDEPGIYLHPDGQHDLVQVMETLAQANQVVYSTHSVFMANKNFPVRHRLVIKTRKGTQIDGKPFRSRWRPAIEALGMSMPGTFLFASRVLLVEGDSDAVLLNASLQKMLERGLLQSDLNSLSIMGTGSTADAAALLRLLKESAGSPAIAGLFDGDGGGERRKKALEKAIDNLAEVERKDVPIKLLSADLTIEDIVPAPRLYVRALAIYLAKMSPRTDGLEADASSYEHDLTARLDDVITESGQSQGLAKWSRATGAELAELEDDPSSLGVAREYAALLQAASDDALASGEFRRMRSYAQWISEKLGLPPLTLDDAQILEEDFVEDDVL